MLPSSQSRLRPWVLAGVLSIVVILIWPFETTVVPAWAVTVVDEQGVPIPDVAVNCHWQNYSVESEGHEERTRTDPSGRVAFPARRVRASALSRITGPVLNLFEAGVHASAGPSGQLVMYGKPGFETGGAVYHGGGSLPTVVVLKRQKV
jgi:hypothetical protein